MHQWSKIQHKNKRINTLPKHHHLQKKTHPHTHMHANNPPAHTHTHTHTHWQQTAKGKKSFVLHDDDRKYISSQSLAPDCFSFHLIVEKVFGQKKERKEKRKSWKKARAWFCSKFFVVVSFRKFWSFCRHFLDLYRYFSFLNIKNRVRLPRFATKIFCSKRENGLTYYSHLICHQIITKGSF